MFTIKQIIEDVSRIDWGRRMDGAPPNYSQRVFDLLWGTCAVESGFVHRRQKGYAPDSLKGAFGLFQTEIPSIERSAQMLAYASWAREKVDSLTNLSGIEISTDTINNRRLPQILQTPAGDIHSCLLARLHYLRVPHPIPDNLRDQARYWLIWYNGKGAMKKFTRAGQDTKAAEKSAIAQYMKAYESCKDKALDIGVTF